MAIILDGRETAKKITEKLRLEVEKLDVKPTLAVIIIGHNTSSIVYVKNQEKKELELGLI